MHKRVVCTVLIGHTGLLRSLRAPQPRACRRVSPASPQAMLGGQGFHGLLGQPPTGSQEPTFTAWTLPSNALTWWNALENPLGVPKPHPKFCFPSPPGADEQLFLPFLHFPAPPCASLPPKPTGTGTQRGPVTYSKALSKNNGFLLETYLSTSSLTSYKPYGA